MSAYLLMKWVHILSSVLLVGTGFGTAFYLFFANRSGNVPAMSVVSRLVVRADWWFTTPTVVIQPLSGFALMRMTGWSWDTPWLLLSLALFGLAGVCWLPVVWLQLRMAKMADAAQREGAQAMPALYFEYARTWARLGYPAFIAMLAAYWLMVHKPVLWG